MYGETILSTAKSKLGRLAISAILTVALWGCAGEPEVDMRVHTNGPKNIFIFIDGTNNNAHSQTNVRRLYEELAKEGGPRTVLLYIEGVGDARHPVTGSLFGKGMDYRIVEAYAELMKVYRFGNKAKANALSKGVGDGVDNGVSAGEASVEEASENDHVYILGFSRGAHIARALAGLISYAGLPVIDTKARDLSEYRRLANKINEFTKGKEDSLSQEYWKAWTPENMPPPPLAPMVSEMALDESFGKVGLEPVRIDFLGIWETVPGSAFKDYGDCMEDRDRAPGTRYKTNSYPTIKVISHAVANDEKRSRFGLLHVCKPITPATLVNERIFPGAHSDVGGGYENPRDMDAARLGLPNLTLNWMIDQLCDVAGYKCQSAIRTKWKGQGDPLGIAHWSRTGIVMRTINSCVDRDFAHHPASGGLPESVVATVDASVLARTQASPVPLASNSSSDAPRNPYPMSCRQYEARSSR